MKRSVSLRLLALTLAACLMLTGCSLFTSRELHDPIKDGQAPQTPPTTQAPREKTQREKLYDYLFDTIIPQQDLAKLEPITWIHSSSLESNIESNLQYLQENGYLGILSAVARDFDMDGNEELVVFRMDSAPQNKIWEPIFNPQFQWLSYIISADLYTFQDGQIQLSDSCPYIATLDGLSWGFITVSLEQLEDGIYIQAHSDAMDYQTYGASPKSIFHIQDGKFVFDYLSGIRYGQASYDGDPNEVLGTTNIKPREYTFFSIDLPCDQVDPTGDQRENRYVLNVQVTMDEDNWHHLIYTATDYTGLRIIQEKGLDAFPHDPLPQGGRLPEDQALKFYEPIGQDFIDHIIAQTGCEITDSFCQRSESTGEVTFTWRTKCKNGLMLRLNEDGSFSYIALDTPEWKEMDAFMGIRDAIISYPKLGLNPEELAVFHGKVSSKYLNGYEVTGATVMMGIVSSTMFRITYHQSQTP